MALRDFRIGLLQAADESALQAIFRQYLSKQGTLRTFSQQLRDVPPASRPAVAAVFNEIKETMTREFAGAQADVQRRAALRQLAVEWQDLSMPGLGQARGARHPVLVVQERSLELLRQLGFQVGTGPEVETPFYNFDALNIPESHPARDMQDTFWVQGNLVLRSHTTPVQARTLETRPPLPIKVVAAGRVYRNEAVDATHLAMFHQLDGFWVDRGINLAHLKGVIEFVARSLYGNERRLRVKPKFYPYTAPSIGMDVECAGCQSHGCEACHGAGWVTIIGAGMIHRNVLTQFGYDPKEVTGMAFGWGTTRMASQWLGVSRVKSLYDPI